MREVFVGNHCRNIKKARNGLNTKKRGDNFLYFKPDLSDGRYEENIHSEAIHQNMTIDLYF